MNAAAPPIAGFDGIEAYCGDASISRRLMVRAAIVYGLIVLAGLATVWLSLAPTWQVAGLGVVWPGGGFVALGGWHWISFIVATALMLVACAAWLLMGNMFAPLFIWIGSAVVAAALATNRDAISPSSPWIVPAIAFVTLGALALRRRANTRAELTRRDNRNAYLPRALRELAERAAPIPAAGSRELSRDDLAQLRYALDRGLQPVEGFAGFDVIEQFQTSSLRYQINHLLWGLQLAQCHYTPNFHGYLSQAQRNLIDKLTQRKVWDFWRWENLFGNFSFNRDPIARDNIMFGGFSSSNVALYTANTGDPRYLADGSLTFRVNERKAFRHSLKTMLDVGRMNHAAAVYGPLYPCEPKLTYSACNLWGNFAFLVSDRMEGRERRGELIAGLREGHLREMLCRDGSVHAGRVTPLGIRIPVYTCNFVFALWGWMANAFFPDLSRRVWAILREECITFDANGEIKLAAEKYDQVDTGNYRKGEGGLHAHFLILAQEQGDTQVAQAILRKLDRDFGRRDEGGALSYDMSNVNNATVLMGRLMRTHDLRRMFLDGPGEAALRGPILVDVPYPDVLVAKAVSRGDDLELVLLGGGSATRASLGIERLQPGAVYALRSGEGAVERVTADTNGKLRVEVSLDGRQRLHLEPEAPQS